MIRLACQTRVTGNTTVRRLVLDDEDEELAVGEHGRRICRGGRRGKTGRNPLWTFEDLRRLPKSCFPDVIHALNRYYRMGRIIHLTAAWSTTTLAMEFFLSSAWKRPRGRLQGPPVWSGNVASRRGHEIIF